MKHQDVDLEAAERHFATLQKKLTIYRLKNELRKEIEMTKRLDEEFARHQEEEIASRNALGVALVAAGIAFAVLGFSYILPMVMK